MEATEDFLEKTGIDSVLKIDFSKVSLSNKDSMRTLAFVQHGVKDLLNMQQPRSQVVIMVQLLTGVDIDSCEMTLKKGSVVVEYNLGIELFDAKAVKKSSF